MVAGGVEAAEGFKGAIRAGSFLVAQAVRGNGDIAVDDLFGQFGEGMAAMGQYGLQFGGIEERIRARAAKGTIFIDTDIVKSGCITGLYAVIQGGYPITVNDALCFGGRFVGFGLH